MLRDMFVRTASLWGVFYAFLLVIMAVELLLWETASPDYVEVDPGQYGAASLQEHEEEQVPWVESEEGWSPPSLPGDLEEIDWADLPRATLEEAGVADKEDVRNPHSSGGQDSCHPRSE